MIVQRRSLRWDGRTFVLLRVEAHWVTVLEAPCNQRQMSGNRLGPPPIMFHPVSEFGSVVRKLQQWGHWWGGLLSLRRHLLDVASNYQSQPFLCLPEEPWSALAWATCPCGFLTCLPHTQMHDGGVVTYSQSARPLTTPDFIHSLKSASLLFKSGQKTLTQQPSSPGLCLES